MEIKKRSYLELLAFIAFVMVGFFLHFCNYDNSVFALSEYEENFFAQNNNLFYEPCATNESTGDGTIKISGNTAEEKVWSGLTSFLSEEQAAGVMANLSHESGLNPIRRQGDNTSSDIWSDNASSGWALGLAQWDGTRRPKMLNYVKSKDSSLISLFDASAYTSSADDFISKAGHEKANKLYMHEIGFLKSEVDKSYKGLYNEDSPESAAEYFCKNFERPADTSQCSTTRAKAARKYYEKFAGKTITSGDSSSGESTSTNPSGNTANGSGSNASSITTVALEFADQPAHPDAETNALPAYTEALNKYAGGRDGRDCGVFVSTVLKASNVDPDVPTAHVPTIQEHFDAHPEIYTKVEGIDGTDESQLQSGDILVKRSDQGHIMIYVQKNGEGYYADASQGTRYGGITAFSGKSQVSDVYRVAGTPACEGQGNNSIAQTAIDLAWPEKTSSSKWKYPGGSATDAYKKAAKQVKVAYKGISGTDCGYFVKTVARYSGVDPGFEGVDRAEEKSDIWEVIKWPKSDWDKHEMIQSGDIIRCYRSKGGHWYIAAEIDGKIKRVGASRGGSYGRVEGNFYKASNCVRQVIIRAKNASTSTASTSGNSTSTATKSISETAWELAWPLGTNSSRYNCNGNLTTGCTSGSATDAFKKAIDEVYPDRGWNKCSHAGASCDVFVGTVVRYSGADSNYPRGLDGVKTYIAEHSDLWEYGGFNKEDWKTTLKDGDIIWQDYPGDGGHTFIFLEKDGEYYVAEASLCGSFGHIKKVGDYPSTVGKGGSMYYIRYKGATSSNCDECAGQGDDSAGLKDGGYESVKEANEAVMNEYKSLSNSEAKSKYHIDVGCDGKLIKNCPSFVKYFVNKYTNVTWTTATGNGSQTADVLAKKYNLETGKTPKVYAVFSTASGSTMCGAVKCGHTGVVLGINTATNKIIIGEAGCSASLDWIGAHEYDLNKFSDGSYTYAYLDPILKSGGLK